MHIVVLHQYYLLPGAAGGSRFNVFARAWAAAGHQVSVIAGSLDFVRGAVPSRLARRAVVRERDGEVTVWRCHVPRSHGRSYAGRAWAFAAFNAAAALAARRVPPADVVVATSPPLPICLPARLVRGRGGRRPRQIFEIRDLWPESAVTCGVLAAGAPLTRVLYALEAWGCRTADGICVLSPAFAADLRARRLAPRVPLACVPSGADLAAFAPGAGDPALRRRLGLGRGVVALYAGAHGRANALGQLLDAAALLRHRPDIELALAGDGPERPALMARAAALGLRNVRFLGAQPKAAMPALVRACDIGIAVLQDNPTFRTVYPNKVFDYMACARPIVLGIDGAARALVCREAAAGIFVPPEQPPALAAAIVGLADDAPARARLGAAGHAYVVAHQDRAQLAARYLAWLQARVAA